LRHPDRVIGLILANCWPGGGATVSKVFAPVFRLAYGADLTLWGPGVRPDPLSCSAR